jgi:hypothetical protein
MDDTPRKSGSPAGPDVSDKHAGPTRRTEKSLSVPVPTVQEWDATLARIGKRPTGGKHG